MSIFFYGFSSGLPFLLTLSTLSLWLKEVGLSHTTIGIFVFVTIPYTFKFLWGPVVDRIRIPFLFGALGQRRSWAFVSQIMLMFMLVGLGSSDPRHHIFQTALWALGVAFCSAVQDITIEAYRIEIIDEDRQGSAASSSYLGYRMGMMTSSVGALYLATLFSWKTAYITMAALVGVGLLTTLLSLSPPHFTRPPEQLLKNRSLREWMRSTYLLPFKDLSRALDWRIVLAFVFFYKIGDTTLNVMNMPFLVDLGFSNIEIANVAKFFGISAMILGGIIGGAFLNRFGLYLSLLMYAILQIMASLMFVWQALVGCDLGVLTLTIGFENFSCGVGAVSVIAYLSSLCRTPYTATHFALLSSLGSFARILLSSATGIVADLLSWPLFFGVTALASLPFLLLLMYASDHFPHSSALRLNVEPKFP